MLAVARSWENSKNKLSDDKQVSADRNLLFGAVIVRSIPNSFLHLEGCDDVEHITWWVNEPEESSFWLQRFLHIRKICFQFQHSCSQLVAAPHDWHHFIMQTIENLSCKSANPPLSIRSQHVFFSKCEIKVHHPWCWLTKRQTTISPDHSWQALQQTR